MALANDCINILELPTAHQNDVRDEPKPEPGTDPARDDSSSSDEADSRDDSTSSNKSQMLEEYPPLTSYALNRLFVHARAGSALGANPTKVLEKLVLQDCWSRWCLLQENVTEPGTLPDFLQSGGLGDWIWMIDQLVEPKDIEEGREER